MKITIIPSDGVVGVDGVFRKVDMAGIDPGIHAVQFDDVAGTGEIEWRNGKNNTRITDISGFQPLLDRWNAAAPIVPTPDPLAEANAKIKAQITVLDLKRIRPMAEGDAVFLAELTDQIKALRAQLK